MIFDITLPHDWKKFRCPTCNSKVRPFKGTKYRCETCWKDFKKARQGWRLPKQ